MPALIHQQAVYLVSCPAGVVFLVLPRAVFLCRAIWDPEGSRVGLRVSVDLCVCIVVPSTLVETAPNQVGRVEHGSLGRLLCVMVGFRWNTLHPLVSGSTAA